MQGDQTWASALIHTSYFDCDPVREAIAKRIAGVPVTARKTTSEPPQVAPHPRKVGKDSSARFPVGSLWGLIGWVLRSAIKAAVFLSPVLLLGLFGLIVLYPYSRDYHLAWAADYEVALQVANDELDPGSDQWVPQRTPLVVRWWVAQCLLDKSLNDATFGERIKNTPKRCLFYASVGLVFAQLGDDDDAAKALILSRNEIAACQVTIKQSHWDRSQEVY